MIKYMSKLLYKLAFKLDKVSKPAIDTSLTRVHESSVFSFERPVHKKDSVVDIEQDTQIPSQLIFDREGAKISIGQRSFINTIVIAAQEIQISDNVIISWGVRVFTNWCRAELIGV
jgi:UDP-3-O-[3-hydroxymyristoyl] glucosamine N-acyltransferase